MQSVCHKRVLVRHTAIDQLCGVTNYSLELIRPVCSMHNLKNLSVPYISDVRTLTAFLIIEVNTFVRSCIRHAIRSMYVYMYTEMNVIFKTEI